MLLSKKPYGSWREVQDEYENYKASLGPWSHDQVIEYLSDEYQDIQPSPREQVEALLPAPELVREVTFSSADVAVSNCQCDRPPFHFTNFKTVELGEDSFGAEIAIDTCNICGLSWVNCLIEEPHYSKSGRWWRAVLPNENRTMLSAENARAFVEQQGACFVGGSYFNSTGYRINSPIKIA